MEPFIHPTAVIEEGAVLGEGCRVAAYAVIKRYVRMGARNRVHEHAVIGGDPQDLAFAPDTVSHVEIGDDNVFREGVTVHRGTKPGGVTRIGNGCYFMAIAHVAHDCTIGSHVIMVNNSGTSGYVTVGERAFLSGAAAVHQFCRIGRNAMLGLNAKLVQDALPFCITDGNPARARGLNLVGLRRAGFKAGDIAALKDAYRLLYQKAPLPEVIEKMKASASAPVRELAEFIASSKRGFAHPDSAAD
jgi:UDP-N-acetylglucosamine acyltransferase